MIVFVGAVIAGATGAFFSDTETSTGNVFAAGAIDLKIDNTSYGFDWNGPNATGATGQWGPNSANSWGLSDLTGQLFFDFHDLKPGDFGEDTISLHVDDNDAWACMAFALTGTPENGQNEPEAQVDTTAGANEGELQNYLSFLFWNDDGDNVLEVGEQVIQSLSGLSSSIFSGNWLAIADTSGDNDVPLPGDTTQYIGKGWCFGTITATPVAAGQDVPPTPGNTGFTCNGAGNQNDAQTDGIVVDVGFYAEQSRNNPNFQCSALPQLQPTAGRAVGAALAEFEAPATETCNLTASDSESIQTELNSAVNGDIVCVDPSYDRTGDNAAIRMETANVTLVALTQGILLDVPVVLSADGVTVTGFEGTIGQAESPAEQAAFYVDGDADGFEISFNTVTGGVGAAIIRCNSKNNKIRACICKDMRWVLQI